jgi:predicted ATP-grasp superfamily ATP-dependent carboligase
MAASVAFLCGPREVLPLPPCRQCLSDDGRFAYLGGELPLPPSLARRAVELGRRCILSLPESRGYVGIDLTLGADESGEGDCVIEVNPRLTTSYIGLRTAAAEGVNLAAAMLEVAEGRPARLAFRGGCVRFSVPATLAALDPPNNLGPTDDGERGQVQR